MDGRKRSGGGGGRRKAATRNRPEDRPERDWAVDATAGSFAGEEPMMRRGSVERAICYQFRHFSAVDGFVGRGSVLAGFWFDFSLCDCRTLYNTIDAGPARGAVLVRSLAPANLLRPRIAYAVRTPCCVLPIVEAVWHI